MKNSGLTELPNRAFLEFMTGEFLQLPSTTRLDSKELETMVRDFLYIPLKQETTDTISLRISEQWYVFSLEQTTTISELIEKGIPQKIFSDHYNTSYNTKFEAGIALRGYIDTISFNNVYLANCPPRDNFFSLGRNRSNSTVELLQNLISILIPGSDCRDVIDEILGIGE